MKFYTSYFGNPKLGTSDMVLISISRWDSRWKGWKLKSLAPSEDLLRRFKSGKTSIGQYTIEFNEMLSNKDCQGLVDNLRQKFGDRDVCFLCFESPDRFCHRHLVADWLLSNGHECKEWGGR